MKFFTNVQLVGDSIYYRGYNNGEQEIYRDRFAPTLFVPSKISTKYKTLDDIYVSPIKFNRVKEAREFIKKYEDVDNFQIYGYERFLSQYIADEFPQNEIKFDISQLKIYCLDIEVACENGFPNVEAAAEEMLCITVKDLNTKKVYVWGTREYQSTRSDVEFRVFWTEQEMLKDFISWWVQATPDIITGWNVYLYDIPYIMRRLDRVLSEKYVKSMSPWSMISSREIVVRGRKQIVYELTGISCLDYYDLYQKFTYTNQESYRLDHIAQVELGEQKLDHSEFENFKQFYTENWQKFVEYNIRDVELVERLDDKMKLIELCLTMAYDAKQNYEDVYSQVKTWDNIIFNYLKKSNIVVPPKKSNKKDYAYEGAYVKDPIVGKHEWVVSFDLNSLYPHLIMQYNISPETLLDEKMPGITVNKLLNMQVDTSSLDCTTVCANGAMYNIHQQGFLPKLMQKTYEDRTIYKKKMIAAKQQYEKTPTIELKKEIARCNNIQMARKIQLNSAYGAIGNEYFRYFHIANAEAITLSGQLSIRWIEKSLNAYMNKILKSDNVDYVIAIDTDSIYLNMGPFVNAIYNGREKTTESIVSFLDKVCQMEFEKYIESSYQKMAKYVNAYEQKMQMKRENIADKGIWTAKKRYILNVWDSEGVRYKEPKMKIMGLETARSSTPSYYRDKLKKAFKIILTKDNNEVIKFIKHIKEETKKQDISDISFPRGLNNLDKYKNSVKLYAEKTPIQVRGAILYNHLVKKLKLSNKYPYIQEGEKIKFVYLRLPNPIGENVISYFQTLPEEFELHSYIDYHMQFQTSFLKPLQNVLDSIGWVSEKRGTLEGFI
jgi:DNA polymerase elongation subunit (family B)